jgi:hypothetical protein
MQANALSANEAFRTAISGKVRRDRFMSYQPNDQIWDSPNADSQLRSATSHTSLKENFNLALRQDQFDNLNKYWDNWNKIHFIKYFMY